MNNDAIGVFDSGIGGLTCVKELNLLMPNENIIYFGDTARVPYGTRSRDTVLKYAEQDIAFIKRHNVKLIIAACGTVSSVFGTDKKLIEKYAGDIPFTGVVVPAVQAACGATRNNRIGVIGTPATIKSGAYGKAIRNIRPDITVIGNSCPMFVPLVENGFTGRDNKVAKLIAQQYLEPIKRENVDTLILGCTHYPVLYDVIADYMGDGVKLISSGGEAARFACSLLTGSQLLTERTEHGKNVFYASDSVEMFSENAHTYLGSQTNGDVFKADIDEF